ncbi:MAG: response regulator, partial [Anaerolineae bacterium]|nr:response regulator [Anaerolineae bacterium]
VCDWKLPDMEGMALLRHMRDTERYIVTPFIMTAVELRKEEIMELLQEGVSDLL